MPRNRNPGHDPDDRKPGERARSVGHRGDEYEDVEDARAKPQRDASDDADDETLAEEDIVEEVDLDAPAQGEGPDA